MRGTARIVGLAAVALAAAAAWAPGLAPGAPGVSPAPGVTPVAAPAPARPDPATQPWAKLFEARQYKDADGKVLYYRLARPEKLDPAAKPPLLIFLHGSASAGNDNISQVVMYRQLLLDAVQKYGAVAVAPQAPPRCGFRVQPDTRPAPKDADPNQSRAPLKLMLDALPQLQKEFNLDTNRYYVCGWSMGGAGTLAALKERPEMFAAAATFAAPMPPDFADWAATIAKTPLWVFQGGKDVLVTPEKHGRPLVEALKQAGGNPRYTEFPNESHDLRGGLYGEKDFLPWLFAQKRGAAGPRPTP